MLQIYFPYIGSGENLNRPQKFLHHTSLTFVESRSMILFLLGEFQTGLKGSSFVVHAIYVYVSLLSIQPTPRYTFSRKLCAFSSFIPRPKQLSSHTPSVRLR